MSVNSYRDDEHVGTMGKRQTLARLFSYLLQYKKQVVGVVLCMAVTVAISLVNPLKYDAR